MIKLFKRLGILSLFFPRLSTLQNLKMTNHIALF